MSRVKKKFISTLKNSLEFFGIGIISLSRLRKIYLDLEKSRRAESDLKFLNTLPTSNLVRILPLLNESNSQLRQDLFVLSETNFKKNGYYVEFGATNGIDLSNTYILERDFGWKGILAEPAKIWSASIEANRPGSFIESSCVWKESNKTLRFNETRQPELSTINFYSEIDGHFHERKSGTYYDVSTISLNDLLKKFNAPRYIDYLSIDTEGSEFEILSTFDFSEYAFRVITCEHNFTSNREKVNNLLSKNGYKRKYENISGFDDWYVAEHLR
jgi:FkbM family methyltransferase